MIEQQVHENWLSQVGKAREILGEAYELLSQMVGPTPSADASNKEPACEAEKLSNTLGFLVDEANGILDQVKSLRSRF